jgi:hypothetical protein
VLQEIKARFDAVPGLYLTAIENKEGEITIRGESPNEYSVTKFGQSLEFSNGLFSNLNIETTRELAKASSPTSTPQTTGHNDSNALLPEVVTFTVKANFGKKDKDSQPAPAPANQVAMKK